MTKAQEYKRIVAGAVITVFTSAALSVAGAIWGTTLKQARMEETVRSVQVSQTAMSRAIDRLSTAKLDKAENEKADAAQDQRIADVMAQLAAIRRDQAEIRRDQSETLRLLVQIKRNQ